MGKCICPKCNQFTEVAVKDSRPSPIENVMRRRLYLCASCDQKFATHEVPYLGEGIAEITSGLKVSAFLREVEMSARHHFGDEKGRMFHNNYAQAGKEKPRK